MYLRLFRKSYITINNIIKRSQVLILVHFVHVQHYRSLKMYLPVAHTGGFKGLAATPAFFGWWTLAPKHHRNSTTWLLYGLIL